MPAAPPSNGPEVGTESSLTRPARTQRPPIARRQAIAEYTINQLAAVARWIQSDGRLRTDDELVEAMMEDLGFERRGRRIEATMREALLLLK
jgi:hypothetical protein